MKSQDGTQPQDADSQPATADAPAAPAGGLQQHLMPEWPATGAGPSNSFTHRMAEIEAVDSDEPSFAPDVAIASSDDLSASDINPAAVENAFFGDAADDVADDRAFDADRANPLSPVAAELADRATDLAAEAAIAFDEATDEAESTTTDAASTETAVVDSWADVAAFDLHAAEATDASPEAVVASPQHLEPMPADVVSPETAADDAALGTSADDLPESYQSHFLAAGEDEPEYVAHVETRLPSPGPATAAAAPDVPAKAAGTVAPAVALVSLFTAMSPEAKPAVQVAKTKDASRRVAKSAVAEPAAVNAAALVPEDETVGDPIEDEAVAFNPPDNEPPLADYATPAVDDDQDDLTDLADELESADAEAAAVDVSDAYEAEPVVSADVDADADATSEDEADVEASPENEPVEPLAAGEDVDDHTWDDDDSAGGSSLVGAGAYGGGWTIPMLCLGIAVIACCLIIPQADANRRLSYDRTSLRQDLESVQAQVATNDEFLRKLAGDPQLAERLAQRQMKLVRPGTKILPIGQGDAGTSPFDLVQVSPPPVREPYAPIGGKIATICYDARTRLYAMGAGLFLLAAGVVLGAGGRGRE